MVLALSISFLIQIVKTPLWYLLTGTGLFASDKYISLTGAVSNIVLSVIFVLQWGLVGVIVGTIISQAIQFVLKSVLIFQKFFQTSGCSYWWILVRGINGFLSFFVSCIICAIVPNIITLVFYRKTEGYLYVKNLAVKMMSRVRSKG